MDLIEMMRDLRGDKCRCGKAKLEMQSFCHRCYHALPWSMQRALYRPVGGGYETAFIKAIDYLDSLRAELAKAQSHMIVCSRNSRQDAPGTTARGSGKGNHVKRQQPLK